METGPLRLTPLYMDRVWGGRRLESIYGRALPAAGMPYGESWEVVDREEAQSVVASGPFAGRSLNDLWITERETVFGRGLPDSPRFPLLVKILDARERLSIQVHPPKGIAEELGGEPKSEMWYIAAADPGAELYVGLRPGVGHREFALGIAEGTTEELVHRIPVQAGEHIAIPSGRLHAIGAGLLIFEIQQNSDTTYRVFDWNRVGLDGKPRQLHVAESLRCIDFSDIEPKMDRAKGEVLAEGAHFRVEKWELEGTGRRPAENGEFSIMGVVAGTLRCGMERFVAGDFFLVPAGLDRAETTLVAEGKATVLRTTLPQV
jgi:mannose-6-phosphate isomerase